MRAVNRWIGFAGVILSAILMGIGEGSVIGLEFNYTLAKVLPILALYAVGVTSYMIGLFILADRIGTVIGVWEFLAIGFSITTAVYTLIKNGGEFHVTQPMVIWGIVFVIGIIMVIVAGDKFLSFFL